MPANRTVSPLPRSTVSPSTTLTTRYVFVFDFDFCSDVGVGSAVLSSRSSSLVDDELSPPDDAPLGVSLDGGSSAELETALKNQITVTLAMRPVRIRWRPIQSVQGTRGDAGAIVWPV
jgi:hypothetical protein